MMISPLGSFLTTFDTAILGAMNDGISGLVAYAQAPTLASLAIYYVLQGVKVAKGDGEPIQNFVTRAIRNGIILIVGTKLAVYNYWVRDAFFTVIPGSLTKAVVANTFGDGAVNVAGGVQAAGSALDHVWAQLGARFGTVLAHSDFFDFSTRLGAVASYFGGGFALLVIAMVYEMARFIMAVVLELGVIAIWSLIFDATKGFFENWLGKVVSLIFLQVAAIVVLQIVLNADAQFMDQINSAAGDGIQGISAELQGLLAEVMLLFMSAFAVYSLPAIAYSIGGGVAINVAAPLMLAMLGRAVGAISMPSLGGGGAASEGISLGLPQAELGASRAVGGMGGGGWRPPPPEALPPPPLSLAHG